MTNPTELPDSERGVFIELLSELDQQKARSNYSERNMLAKKIIAAYDAARAQSEDDVIERCAKIADTEKGYPTATSEAIRALKSSK